MELKQENACARNAHSAYGSFARYNLLLAFFVFLTAFEVYRSTVAPSVAFWDCGEYIGASHSLGIPHPPGNPLFVLIMRVSSILLPFFEDVGYRMNFVVALSSALAAMFIYLVIVEAAKMFVGRIDTWQKRVCLHVGGVVGGLFTAFGYTFWFSAVETSVYNLTMLNLAICTWLMLRWAQSRKPDRDKLLILVAFLGFLGIGLHMYSMVIFPPAFLFMMLWDEKKRYDWRLWITGVLMASIVYSLATFIWVAPIVLVVNLIMSFASRERKYEWQLCLFFSLFAVLGYSVHAFIPIRSALEPMINENHPSTWDAFVGFLERRQYGSESMLTRMFWRRGQWANQLGIEGHMGFGGFHLTQFFRFDMADTERSFFSAGAAGGMSKLLIYLIPTALMIYGWLYFFKRNRAAATFLISIALLTSVGIALYMNFADGTRPERYEYEQWVRMGQPGPMPTVHREVRVRDYFFTAGFMYFGMWVGLASSCLLHALYSSKDGFTKKTVATVCAVLLAVSPVIPAVTNHKLNNRSGDWLPYDYAYNLLNSCEPDGIIFTNGDNDTFPLWALQEAYGIRNDVRVVNLSLVNTDWYIKQLKKLEPKVAISYSEKEIENLQPQLNPFAEPRQHTLRKAGITLTLPGQREQRALRVQDLMVLNIVDNTKWEKPVYFAMTVSDDNLMGLAPYLQAQGMVYRVMPQRVSGDDRYNLDRTIELIDSVYQLRGIGKAKYNDTSRRLLANYLQIAFDLRRPLARMKMELDMLKTEIAELETDSEEPGADTAAGKADSSSTDEQASAKPSPSDIRVTELEERYNRYTAAADRFLGKCVELMPWDWRPRGIRHEFYIDHGRTGDAVAAMEQAIKEDTANIKQYEQMLEQAIRMKEANQ